MIDDIPIPPEQHDQVAVIKLSKDLKEIVGTLDANQARMLVDNYYSMQKKRIREDAQVRDCEKSTEPNAVLDWFAKNSYFLEKQVLAALKEYANAQPMGRWAMQHKGIGPVIASGLCAHIDISEVKTAGAIWRFCGLDPTLKWLGQVGAKSLVDRAEEQLPIESKSDLNALMTKCCEQANRRPERIRAALEKVTQEKGKKEWSRSDLVAMFARRPWNASLKVICWKMGESFVKVSGDPKAFYGQYYAQRKEYRIKKNLAGDYATHAAEVLKTRPGHAQAATYKQGILPDGHIHSQAKRDAVKLFLAHWFEEAYRQHYHQEPPKPYPIAILGHVHYIPAPGDERSSGTDSVAA